MTFATDRRANAAIEFAFVLPVMLLIFGGIIEFGRAYQSYSATNRLASRIAAAWADCNDDPAGTCGTEMALYNPTATLQNLSPKLSNPIALRMFEVTMAGAVPTPLYASPAGTSPSADEAASAAAVIPPGGTGIIVTVTYLHTMIVLQQLMRPFLGDSRTISYTVVQLKS